MPLISKRKVKLSNPQTVAETMRAILASEGEVDRNKEHFWVIGLNVRNVVQYIELVALGTLTSTVIHPREVFRFAIMKGVASIIIAHNHPSGDPSPSREDRVITEKLQSCGQILGIEVLDHIIVGDEDFYSFTGN